jgi:hypothetical protein
MAYISETLRQEVIKRAQACCEYCQMQKIVVVFMEIDHIIPESRGGETISENLCLACAGCNAFKLDSQTGTDPETQEEIALYHPRQDQWNEHFQWSGDALSLIGRSAKGRATIERLRMNRPEIIASRKLWIEAGWHPPK